ncbi:MAG: hypothetical protein OJF51_001975 [Nitrospira sp.]|jgi:hypothetical protein|nr:MAG: hypothetical protein OJF51_001975 [Nitrospira sp.]
MNKERHVCARRRVGEPAVSESLHVCGRRRVGEVAVSWGNANAAFFNILLGPVHSLLDHTPKFD